MESEVERRMLDLMQSEGRMRFILNAAGMGVWTLDLKNQRLVASRHCKANFGRSGDEPFSYADLQEAIVPEDRDRWRETVEAAIASGDEFDVEYRIKTPSGETRWVEVRGRSAPISPTNRQAWREFRWISPNARRQRNTESSSRGN